jgi:UDP-N-acetyl-2-amino-2-deoxyglucuronate dehydrogenase
LRRGTPDHHIHYVSICTPNYLHDAHARFALRVNADAICEKPMVLEPWNVDALQEMEREHGRRIWCILQLRLHPQIIALRQQIATAGDKIHDIDLTYIASRGRWYMISWKGVDEKSGGVAMNIGVHFFDMLLWIFGPVKQSTVHFLNASRGAGYLELQRARIRWFLSVDAADLPAESVANGLRTHRALKLDGKEYEFSEGFGDLHTEMYRAILNGSGFGAEDVKPSIQLVHDIRHSPQTGLKGDFHPLALKKAVA